MAKNDDSRTVIRLLFAIAVLHTYLAMTVAHVLHASKQACAH